MTTGNIGIGSASTIPTALLTIVGSQPAASSVNGAAATPVVQVTGGQGGNTTGTSGQVAGAGASVSVTGGNGGNAASGSTNGNGGSITLQGGAPGTGGAGGAYGNVFVCPQGGLVGIGTSQPDSQLTLAGNLHLTASNGRVYFQGGPADPNYYIETYLVDTSAGIRVRAAQEVVLGTSSGDLLYVESTGRVGVGNNNPQHILDVSGDGHFTLSLTVDGTNSNFGTAPAFLASQVPSLSVSEATYLNQRLAWLQFHDQGVVESFIRLASDRTLELGNSQNVSTQLALLSPDNSTRQFLLNAGSGQFKIGNTLIADGTGVYYAP